MILNIKNNKTLILEMLKEHEIEYEILSESDYINPYDLLTEEIMQERNIDKECRHVLFSRIVDATDEIGFDLGDESE